MTDIKDCEPGVIQSKLCEHDYFYKHDCVGEKIAESLKRIADSLDILLKAREDKGNADNT